MSRLFSGTSFDRPKPCERCGMLPAACRCLELPEKKKGKSKVGYELTPENATPPKDQVAKIYVEKRKGGREVTVIRGLEHPANDLVKLCTQLKALLGAGGAVQERTVELQGDHADKIKQELEERNIKARIM